MTVQELLKLVLADIEVEPHPLHRAMFEECCENALANEQGITEAKVLAQVVRVAFISCNSLFKNTILSALESADIISCNYRGLTFTVDKDFPLLKLELSSLTT